jgi:hypothetical protein
LWPGSFSALDRGDWSLVPFVVGSLVPVVVGRLVPVGPGKLVLVSKGSRDLPLTSRRGGRPQLWSVVAGTLALVEVGRLVPVSRGSRGLPLSCSWRGRSRVEAGALVPVVAGALVPVEAGALVPVEAVLMVPVFQWKPGPPPYFASNGHHDREAATPTQLASVINLIEVLASQVSQDHMA